MYGRGRSCLPQCHGVHDAKIGAWLSWFLGNLRGVQGVQDAKIGAWLSWFLVQVVGRGRSCLPRRQGVHDAKIGAWLSWFLGNLRGVQGVQDVKIGAWLSWFLVQVVGRASPSLPRRPRGWKPRRGHTTICCGWGGSLPQSGSLSPVEVRGFSVAGRGRTGAWLRWAMAGWTMLWVVDRVWGERKLSQR